LINDTGVDGERKHTLCGITNTFGGRASGVADSFASARDGIAYSVGQTFASLADRVRETSESTFWFWSTAVVTNNREERGAVPLLSDIIIL
jgi:hypothetical protein